MQAMTHGMKEAEAAAGGAGYEAAGPRMRHSPGSASASDMEAGLAGRAAEPISRYESRSPKDAGKLHPQSLCSILLDPAC